MDEIQQDKPVKRTRRATSAPVSVDGTEAPKAAKAPKAAEAEAKTSADSEPKTENRRRSRPARSDSGENSSPAEGANAIGLARNGASDVGSVTVAIQGSAAICNGGEACGDATFKINMTGIYTGVHHIRPNP